MLLHDVNDAILMPAICRVSGNNFVFQQDSALAHRAMHVQQLNCSIKKRQTFLGPTYGLQTAQTAQYCGLRDLRCHAALMCLPQTSP